MNEQTTEHNPEELTKKQRREIKRQEKLEKREHEASKQSMKRIITWSAVLVGIVLVVVVIINGTGNSEPTPDSVSNGGTNIVASDWTKGNPASGVELIEYSDFQCPACGSFFPVIKQLEEEAGEEFNFAYRHFPLRSIHPNAQIAAQAAEAAGMQGKFFEMHDLLFQGQGTWSPMGRNDARRQFLTYATALELDVIQFEEDIDSTEVRNAVNTDYSSANSLGVNSTPTFYLNGSIVSSPPQNVEAFKELIRAATPIEAVAPVEDLPINENPIDDETTDEQPILEPGDEEFVPTGIEVETLEDE